MIKEKSLKHVLAVLNNIACLEAVAFRRSYFLNLGSTFLRKEGIPAYS
jgi:hypothetical protein